MVSVQFSLLYQMSFVGNRTLTMVLLKVANVSTCELDVVIGREAIGYNGYNGIDWSTREESSDWKRKEHTHTPQRRTQQLPYAVKIRRKQRDSNSKSAPAWSWILQWCGLSFQCFNTKVSLTPALYITSRPLARLPPLYSLRWLEAAIGLLAWHHRTRQKLFRGSPVVLHSIDKVTPMFKYLSCFCYSVPCHFYHYLI